MPDKSPAAAEAFDASDDAPRRGSRHAEQTADRSADGERRSRATEIAEAVTFYAKKVQDRLLSYDEAMAELLKQVRSRGLALTELLRSQGAIGVGSTAAAPLRKGRSRDAVRAGGGAVPANQAPYRRPVAMPKPDRPVGKPVMSDAEAAEEDRMNGGTVGEDHGRGHRHAGHRERRGRDKDRRGGAARRLWHVGTGGREVGRRCGRGRGAGCRHRC
jgi:hypothetical protein